MGKLTSPVRIFFVTDEKRRSTTQHYNYFHSGPSHITPCACMFFGTQLKNKPCYSIVDFYPSHLSIARNGFPGLITCIAPSGHPLRETLAQHTPPSEPL